MSTVYPCGACQTGDHDNHDGSHHGIPGVLGGHICCCPGDCKPLPNPLLDLLATTPLPPGEAVPTECPMVTVKATQCPHDVCWKANTCQATTRPLPPEKSEA